MQAVQLLDFIHIAILSECVRERESKRESERVSVHMHTFVFAWAVYAADSQLQVSWALYGD